MKTAGCVALLASAVLVCSMAVEARSVGHGHGSVGHGGGSFGRLDAYSASSHAFAGVSFGRFSWNTAPSPGYGRSAVSYGRLGRSQPQSQFARGYGFGRSHGSAGYSAGGGLQCVTFARADSGIELSGNANTWWSHAEGVYQRGTVPEPGSVLNFRANGVMRMGHVAVVEQVVDGRTVMIDHANWAGPGARRGRISRDVSVVDVSPGNDWSAVRVALGRSGDYGNIYPTYGFIYNRPDGGAMVASNARATAMPELNPAPRDLRPDPAYDEVAEAPEGATGGYARHASYHHHHAIMLTGRHHRRYE